MSETADFDPGYWRGHDFSSARRVYDRHVGRSYGDAIGSGVKMEDLVPESITTNSSAPLVILCDVTGSMGVWPATIFSKLPYLELEGQEYLGKDMEIAWGAIGDAQCHDQYPFQMRQFTKGTDLKKELQELVIEGGGGVGIRESYELAALYCARNIEMPKAINPICIIIGDEGFYDVVNKEDGKKYAFASLKGRITGKEIFEELKRKFSVYLVRKPYNICHYGDGMNSNDGMSPNDKTIYAQWEKVLGSDRIIMLPEANRVVDVIFGILANETDRVSYFEDELKDRQTDEQAKTVMKSLETVHKVPAKKDPKLLKSGKSIMRKTSNGKKTKSLL
jgi:hypothetical protein